MTAEPMIGYVDAIENAHEDPVALKRLRATVRADVTLREPDRTFLDARIGTYLADRDRAREPFTLETVPEEDG
jgi:hypothetical protein